jgi:hypothetical protein
MMEIAAEEEAYCYESDKLMRLPLDIRGAHFC